jgi:hypothetical protein
METYAVMVDDLYNYSDAAGAGPGLEENNCGTNVSNRSKNLNTKK